MSMNVRFQCDSSIYKERQYPQPNTWSFQPYSHVYRGSQPNRFGSKSETLLSGWPQRHWQWLWTLVFVDFLSHYSSDKNRQARAKRRYAGIEYEPSRCAKPYIGLKRMNNYRSKELFALRKRLPSPLEEAVERKDFNARAHVFANRVGVIDNFNWCFSMGFWLSTFLFSYWDYRWRQKIAFSLCET